MPRGCVDSTLGVHANDWQQRWTIFRMMWTMAILGPAPPPPGRYKVSPQGWSVVQLRCQAVQAWPCLTQKAQPGLVVLMPSELIVI
jgi:hypothetical protein